MVKSDFIAHFGQAPACQLGNNVPAPLAICIMNGLEIGLFYSSFLWVVIVITRVLWFICFDLLVK